MAYAVYYEWDRLGRPLEPARPIREIVGAWIRAFPRAAAINLFSWYADEAHYQGEPPEDHTPYSATGEPLPSPRWVVFATDLMHRPDLGVDCNVLMPYYLAEARAGRMPWVKYLIWQAKLYHYRDGFKTAHPNSGHFDHGHLSGLTNHRNTSLGSWSVVPGGEDDMTPQEFLDIKLPNGFTMRNAFVTLLARIPTDLAALKPLIQEAIREAADDPDLPEVLPMSDAQVDLLAGRLLAKVPTADQIRDVVDSELDEAAIAGADAGT